jgi:hypothetical protein
MPMVFYTQTEYTSMQAELKLKAMTLAQSLAEAKGFPCIREPQNAGPDGPGDYCDACPAEDACPFEFKRYSV